MRKMVRDLLLDMLLFLIPNWAFTCDRRDRSVTSNCQSAS